MTLADQRRDRYRRIAHRYRSLPGEHGLRMHTVSVLLATWGGDHTGDEETSISEIPIVERGGYPPKVRWLSQEELTIGALDNGTVEIGPITPDFSGGGTSLETLLGASLDTGDTLHLLITGPQHPDGAKYEVTTSSGDRALHYSLQAKPVSKS